MNSEPNQNLNKIRIEKIYRVNNVFFFGVGLLSMFIGMKVCDYFFYD